MKSETLTPTVAERALRDEHARGQEALRRCEERNRDLVENSTYGIFRVSADGSFQEPETWWERSYEIGNADADSGRKGTAG